MSKKVMVLCTGNSCRSQMAEGFLRSLSGGCIEAHSAGVIASGLNGRAVKVMAEVGVDISHHKSKEIDIDLLRSMDLVITVCDNAHEACPMLPPTIQRKHLPVRDPVHTRGSEEHIMQDFRRARDELRSLMLSIIGELC